MGFRFMLGLVMIANVMGASAVKSEFPELREAEIQRRLKQLNKAAVRSIQSPDGDIIDCVFITDQPAFDHPLLRNHTIQMEPDSYPEGMSIRNKASLDLDKRPNVAAQLWHMNGHCPENTIPIRRTTKEDLLRADLIENYGKKYPNNTSQPKFHNHADDDDPSKYHEYATVFTKGRFHGAKARINVWKPRVQAIGEFSLSQIWLASGHFDSDLNTLEAGWQVGPRDGVDDNPKFFIYWTADSYKSTGCINHLCPGFVQVNRAIALGASISPISTYGGSQFEIAIYIWKGLKTGNWWLQLGEHVVGYWPNSLVPNLADAATEIHWGGEIVNLETNGQHTTTEMGSGHFAEEKHGKASYFANIQVVDMSDTLVDPHGVEAFIPRPSCYNLIVGANKISGTSFYYGGPGRNPRCP